MALIWREVAPPSPCDGGGGPGGPAEFTREAAGWVGLAVRDSACLGFAFEVVMARWKSAKGTQAWSWGPVDVWVRTYVEETLDCKTRYVI